MSVVSFTCAIWSKIRVELAWYQCRISVVLAPTGIPWMEIEGASSTEGAGAFGRHLIFWFYFASKVCQLALTRR